MGAQGTAVVDFGAFPVSSDTSVAVTGQSGILSNSLVEAWLFPADTADHSVDEHVVETIKVVAGKIVAGTGFTIYALYVGEQMIALDQSCARYGSSGGRNPGTVGTMGGNIMAYGQWSIAWVWN